jgi:hypothetical protein
MKYTIILLFVLNTNLYAQKTPVIILQNPSVFARQDEPLLFIKKMLQAKGIKNIPSMVTANGRQVQVQFDDTDADGKWDEMVLLQSFKAKEKIELQFYFDKKNKEILPVRTHIRFGKDASLQGNFKQVTEDAFPTGLKPTPYSVTNMPMYQAEGIIWENDKVAFRLYFDIRNGKDVYGKITNDMVADSIGMPNKDYHTLQPWGMDILKVGKSLGAGAIALVKQINGKDSLVRIGGITDKTTCKIIADGPLRSMLRMYYKGFKAYGESFDMEETISIWGGQYYYDNKVMITAGSKIQIAAGIVNLHSDTSLQIKSSRQNILFTYDKQSENNDNLGLAIIQIGNNFSGFGKAPLLGSDILSTYYGKVNLQKNNLFHYRFYAGWQLTDKQFSSKELFIKFIIAQQQKINEPIIIK